jgi:DNA-binding GntR family transcriptional regulator
MTEILLPANQGLMTNTLSPLDVLQTRTLPDLVQEEIIRMIKAGEIQAGDKLSEVMFVQRLRVSRPPVREAFRALEEAGLVRLEKNRGVFVREISRREAAELYQVRAGLDETAGRLLAPRIIDAQLAELRAKLAVLEATTDIAGYFQANIGFHDRIIEMTGNHTLHELYRSIIDRMHLLRSRSLASRLGTGPSCAEHRAIVDALATHEAGAAALALRQHVENGYQRMLGMDHGEPDP